MGRRDEPDWWQLLLADLLGQGCCWLVVAALVTFAFWALWHFFG